MSISIKRLQLEYKNIMKRKPSEFEVWTIADDIFNWGAKIKGPENSPYEDGVFELKISFPSNYPFKPPKISFVTKIWHPNISKTSGEICLDILKTGRWSAVLKVPQILLSIVSLLTDPNAGDPLNSEAGSMYRKDLESYNEKVREYVNEYARPSELSGSTKENPVTDNQ